MSKSTLTQSREASANLIFGIPGSVFYRFFCLSSMFFTFMPFPKINSVHQACSSLLHVVCGVQLGIYSRPPADFKGDIRMGCRRKWQLTPVFLPGKLHGQRSLVDYSSWGHKVSDTTEQLSALGWVQSIYLKEESFHNISGQQTIYNNRKKRKSILKQARNSEGTMESI